MIHPTLHLNGTSADSLIDGYCEAATAVLQAVEQVCAAAPNARDYYVQGPDAFATARSEHEDRVARLMAVHAELEALAIQIGEQRDERERR